MRAIIFRIIVYLGLGVLGLGLFQIQVLQGEYYRQLGEQNRIRLIPLEAPRGRVLDKRGNLLASNRPTYDVVATPEDVTPDVYPRLGKLLSVPEKDIRFRMSAAREYPFAPAIIAQDIPRELAFAIEERKPELPGVAVRVSAIRSYPLKETAAHLIGYIGRISPKEYELNDHSLYGMTSMMGREGIEKIFDERLRGWRGGRQVEVDARGQLIRIISEKLPEPGQDLVLTLDLELQKRIMDLIKDKHAAVAVMDLKSNGILALASSPAYDPNVFVSPRQSLERMGVLKNPESPLLDRGIASAYPPGSIFKLVTALTALETGKITPQTRFVCTGKFRLKPGTRPFHCWNEQGHGSLNLYQAIERSCNVYFYNVGRRLTPEEIAHYARELGLGERMKLELSQIDPGLVPDSAWKKEKLHDRWYQGETLSYAIGQGYLRVSPLQIMRLVAMIAENGKRVQPHLIEGLGQQEKRESKIAIHPENLDVIRRAMLSVVQSDYGTGQLARVDFDKMAGKTGTAQVPPKKSHAWMTGFFPYENPEISFVVFVEHGGAGGVTAAKIVKEIIQMWKGMGNAAVG